MNTYIIGEANMIHVKGEYYNDKPLIRCSNCGERNISEFDRHCRGCGYMLHRVDDWTDGLTIFHTPPIIEVDELPKFSKRIDVTYFRDKGEQDETDRNR